MKFRQFFEEEAMPAGSPQVSGKYQNTEKDGKQDTVLQ
jgi:hypothetical protein